MNERIKNGRKGEGEKQALQELLQKSILPSFRKERQIQHKPINALQNKRQPKDTANRFQNCISFQPLLLKKSWNEQVTKEVLICQTPHLLIFP